jgi:hypothetical protein
MLVSISTLSPQSGSMLASIAGRASRRRVDSPVSSARGHCCLGPSCSRENRLHPADRAH